MDCTRSRMLFGGRCAFSCHAGFQLQGPSLRECVAPGRWNGGNLMTRCVGIIIDEKSKPLVLSYMISDFFVRINDDLLQFYIIDVTPPVLRCPQNVTTTTAKGLHYAILKMTMPVSQG